MSREQLRAASRAVALTVLLAACAETHGSPPRWTEDATLLPSGGGDLERFGMDVAVSGDGRTVLVGAPFGEERVLGRDLGAWAELATLVPDRPGESFGWSVALSADGTHALLGGRRRDPLETGSGVVFVRAGTTWAHEATLLPADGVGSDQFGDCVELSADASRALVCAPSDETGGALPGSVRVFSRAGAEWSEEATLPATYARAVALSADGATALVGGPDEARVFSRTDTTWAEEATLRPSASRGADVVAISADGSRAIVGVPGDWRTEPGSAFVFVRSGTRWAEEARLVAADGEVGDQVGVSVALAGDGTRALVGAVAATVDGRPEAGRAHLFVRSGEAWLEEATLVASDAEVRDRFGYAVALSADGSTAVIGAADDTTPLGGRGGSVRVYGLP